MILVVSEKCSEWENNFIKNLKTQYSVVKNFDESKVVDYLELNGIGSLIAVFCINPSSLAIVNMVSLKKKRYETELHHAPLVVVVEDNHSGSDIKDKYDAESSEDFILAPFDYLNDKKILRSFVDRAKRLPHISGPHFLIGESKIMNQINKKVTRLGKRDKMSVLITGETGTGKELIAHELHRRSRRSDQVFRKFKGTNRELSEAELLGTDKGALRGNEPAKPGCFELANNGTLFIDEVGELSDDNQGHLLTILEDRQVTRLRGSEVIDLDVRVLFATNKDLLKLVLDGKFRKDLYNRINQGRISLPSLRERPEDIPELLNYFITKFSFERDNRILMRLSEEADSVLTKYSWSIGNVRELKNFIFSLYAEAEEIIDKNKEIGLEDFPDDFIRHLDGDGVLIKKNITSDSDISFGKNELAINENNTSIFESLIKMDSSRQDFLNALHSIEPEPSKLDPNKFKKDFDIIKATIFISNGRLSLTENLLREAGFKQCGVGFLRPRLGLDKVNIENVCPELALWYWSEFSSKKGKPKPEIIQKTMDEKIDP